MNAGLMLAAGSLAALAVGHSLLGEAKLIGPLLGPAPLPAVKLPDVFAKLTLRFAWHLTSLAWLALAYVVVAEPQTAGAVGVLLAVSGAVALLGSRGRHFAWALFFVGALGAFSTVAPPRAGGPFIAVAAATVLSLLGALHAAWALGLRWGLAGAVPHRDGKPLFTPPRSITLLVALALFATAAVVLSLAGLLPALPFVRALGIAAAVVFGIRTLGDLRTMGLFGRDSSRFGKNDALLYTPLCFALSAAFVWVS